MNRNIKLEKLRFPNINVFETMRSYKGRIFKLKQHLTRLGESAKTCGLDISRVSAGLAKKIKDRLKLSGLKEAYIRVSLTYHSKSRDKGAGQEEAVIIIKPLKQYPDEYYKKGVAVGTASGRKNTPAAVDSRIKSGNFLWGVMGKIDFFSNQGFETIYLDHQGYIAEGSVSNIFLVKDKKMITPVPGGGILEGITASVVLDIAAELNIEKIRQPVTRHQLYNADEVFLTNTTMEIMPVRMVDGRVIGCGCRGEMTLRIHCQYRKKTFKNS